MLRHITEKIPMQIGAKACTHSLTGRIFMEELTFMEESVGLSLSNYAQ